MKRYHFLLLISFLIYLTGCNHTEEVQPKKPKEPKVKLHLREEVNSSKVMKSMQKAEIGEAETREALDVYLNALSSFDTQAIVDMTYPKLFDVISLDLFRQYISSMMNAKDIEIQSFSTNITNISSTTYFSNATAFAQADYDSKILIHFLNDELYNNQEKINFLYDALIHKYGKENVQVNVAERTLSIKKAEKLLMIKTEDGLWKFLGDNKKYRRLYPSILPQEILNLLE